MKKILLLSALLGFLFNTAVTAQTFMAENGDTSMVVYSSGNSLKVFNRLKSTSSSPVTVRWRVTNAPTALASGWTLTGLCDNIQCHSASTTLDNTWKTTFQYGNTYDPLLNDFHIEFENMAAAPAGTSVFQVQVQDNSNFSIQKNLTFIATKNAAGVVSVTRSSDDVVVYPNPARDFVNVLFDGSAGVKNIALYNLIGKPVMVYRVQGTNSAKLELDNVASGVYFMRLMNAQGNVIATRRFTHQ